MSELLEAGIIKAENRYASRKFQLSVLVILIALGMSIWGSLTMDQLVDVLKWTLGLYCGFNVTEKATEWLNSRMGSK